MNALLQYKDKLEEQFLSSIDSTDFKDICQGNIEFFKHYLQANFNYPAFCNRTARAKNPLQQFDDLTSYMALYGLAHYQRMRTIIDYVQVMPHFKITQPIEACVVDYGCGQGIASLAFIDHLIESKLQIKCLKLVLIEPSAHALKRAVYWIEKKAKAAEINIEMIALACTFDELEPDYLASNINQYPCFHLFNNILDMYSAGIFSLSKLTQLIKMQPNENFILAASPDFSSGNRGFDALHELTRPNTIYLNTTGTIEVEEYRYTSQKTSMRKAPVRVYAAKL